MGVFDPDDFSDDPYAGGLNQLGHVCFGAALSGSLSVFAPLWVGALISIGIVLAWEAHQFFRRGAKRSDFRADMIYWTIGILVWAFLISQGMVSDLAKVAPALALLAPVAEYARIRYKLTADGVASLFQRIASFVRR